jgi:hypothetical protein
MLLNFISLFLTAPEEDSSQPNENQTSALTQERAKTVDEK